jgi:hypothetical protein
MAHVGHLRTSQAGEATFAPSDLKTAGSELPLRSRTIMTDWGSQRLCGVCANIPVTYDELVKRLKKYGFKGETRVSITMKLKRGAFAAGFLLACLAALELDGVRLEDI